MTRARGEEAEAPPALIVAHVAGPRPTIRRIDRVTTAEATSPQHAATTLETVRFHNAVPFTAHYDGNTLAIEPDRAALRAGARAVEAELARALGETFAGEHPGSVLYLTKYFTPHPNGEPHFFVKPWAFTSTPAGWSSVIEGVCGEGWDVMRGVVWTDRFHATPAVFTLRTGQRVRVPRGAPLLDVLAFPRSLGDDGFTFHQEG